MTAELEDRQRLALVAASQASIAVADLLRFANEGPALVSGFTFEEDVVELLLDATKLAIEASISERHSDIYGHIVAELEGWA